MTTIFIVFTSFEQQSEKEKNKKNATKENNIEEMYSMGEIKAMSPDSIPYGTYVGLTKEIMDKKKNTITMKSVSLDQKGEVTEFNYTMEINDPKFVIHDVDGNYDGSGKLHGQKWKWTNWEYTIYFRNPEGRVEAFNYLSLVGLVVNKAFYDAKGKMTVRYKERHKFITKAQFEILYLQILKCSTK